MAAKFYDREKLDLDTVLAKEWDVQVRKGFSSLQLMERSGLGRLANKALREYRKGRIDQALLWISHNESLTKLPWMWEYPVCIPFRRLRPLLLRRRAGDIPPDQSLKLVCRGLPAANGSANVSRQSLAFP